MLQYPHKNACIKYFDSHQINANKWLDSRKDHGKKSIPPISSNFATLTYTIQSHLTQSIYPCFSQQPIFIFENQERYRSKYHFVYLQLFLIKSVVFNLLQPVKRVFKRF